MYPQFTVHLQSVLFIYRFHGHKGEILTVRIEDGSIRSELEANRIACGLQDVLGYNSFSTETHGLDRSGGVRNFKFSLELLFPISRFLANQLVFQVKPDALCA